MKNKFKKKRKLEKNADREVLLNRTQSSRSQMMNLVDAKIPHPRELILPKHTENTGLVAIL